MAAMGSTLRSRKVWGSGLVGVLALVIGNWLCNREPAPPSFTEPQGQDTTTLTENAPITADTQAAGVKTISQEQLPKDVTVVTLSYTFFDVTKQAAAGEKLPEPS